MVQFLLKVLLKQICKEWEWEIWDKSDILPPTLQPWSHMQSTSFILPMV